MDFFIKQLKLGPMENFCYVLGSKAAKSCFVVDPAWDIEAVKAAIGDYHLAGVLITHYHPDHCGGHLWGHDIPGAAELVGDIPAPVYVHKADLEGTRLLTGLSKTDLVGVDSGQQLELGSHKIQCLHTPGHTPGSMCFLNNGKLVAGDTLFLTGCGRVDLPGGDADQLFHSLNDTLKALPGETILLPGHDYGGASATMSEVIASNPYLKVDQIEDWHRMFGV